MRTLAHVQFTNDGRSGYSEEARDATSGSIQALTGEGKRQTFFLNVMVPQLTDREEKVKFDISVLAACRGRGRATAGTVFEGC